MPRDVKFGSGIRLRHDKGAAEVCTPSWMTWEAGYWKPTNSVYGAMQKMVAFSRVPLRPSESGRIFILGGTASRLVGIMYMSVMMAE